MSAALVVFMVPGLALFYGGMSRSKNMLNMLMMNMICLGIVPIFWFVIGYSLSSTGTDNGWIGTLDYLFLNDIGITGEDGGAALRDVFFALTFACITPALISGAVADRLKAVPEIDYLVITTGRFDLLAEVVATTPDHFLETINRIRSVDGIQASEVFGYLRLEKQSYDWGTR